MPKNFNFKALFAEDFKTDIENIDHFIVQDTPEDFNVLFETEELFDVDKLLILHSLLSDLNIENPENPVIKKSFKTVDTVVNSGVENIQHKIEDTFFIRKMEYGFRNNQKVGRIQPVQTSVPYFSKQIRNYLFGKTYLDVDLINSHPTILYDYAIKNGIPVNFLKSLVKERDAVFKQICNSSNLNLDQVKQSFLILINLTDSTKNKGYNFTEFHLGLYEEIVKIREHMFHNFENSQYHNIFDYCNKLGKSSLEQIKLSYQTFYCFTKESELLLSLKSFFENSKQNNYDFLSFIPFFDGAYINYFPWPANKNKDFLARLLNEFNLKNSPFRFIIKDIPDKSFLKDKDLMDYTNIYLFLKQLDNLQQVDLILKKIGIEEFRLTEDIDFLVRSKLKSGNTKKSKLDLEQLSDSEVNLALLNHTRKYYCKVRRALQPYAGSLERLKTLLDN